MPATAVAAAVAIPASPRGFGPSAKSAPSSALTPMRADRVWSQEVPAEWERELRAITPIRSTASWLAFRWFPMVRQDEAGTWHDAGRWVLFDCVPAALVPEAERDILVMLADTPPSRLPLNRRMGRLRFVDDWTCAMYRAHGVWARPAWVLQGSQGGHPVVYQPEEQAVLRARGLPTEPPAVGALPYAPFDARARRQLIRRNTLIQVGNDLDQLRRLGTPDAQRRAQEQAERAFRAEYVDFLTEQQEPQVDFLTWYSRTKECRETIPAASRAQLNAASVVKDQFIETGTVPHVA